MLLLLIIIGLYFAFGKKSAPAPAVPLIATDPTTVVQDTVVDSLAIALEATPVPEAVKQPEKPKPNPQVKAEPSAQPKPQAAPKSDSQSQPQSQSEPAAAEKKAQSNTLDAAREATQNGDFKKAFEIYKGLANAGNAEAQYCLGIMYETGKGVNIDIFEAVMWYRKAKAKGFKLAERKLQELGYN